MNGSLPSSASAPLRPAGSPPSAEGLPGPDDRPEADVVIFDGHCRFCSAQVRRLARFDRSGRLSFLSLHDPETARRYPELSHERLMEELVIVDRSGVSRGGAAAFRYLSRRLPLLWPLAPLLHLPFSLPVWSWLYRQIARRRYLIAGRTDACENDACAVHFRR